MKKLILGFIIGVAVLVFFLYMGGSKYVKELGKRTEQAGEKLESYEKKLKRTAREASEVVRETVKDTKDAVEETAGDAREAVDKTRKKVKDIVD